MPLRRKIKNALAVLLGIWFCTLFWRSLMDLGHLQWDLKIYLAAAQTLQAGQNPYDPATILQVVPTAPPLQWLYPPHLLSGFEILNRMEFARASALWLILQVLSASIVMGLWWKRFGKNRVEPLEFIFCAGFALGNPLMGNFRSGNVTTFEEVMLWIGVEFLLLGYWRRFLTFGALAAQWKVSPLFFSLSLFFANSRPKLISIFRILAGLGIFIAYLFWRGDGPILGRYREALSKQGALDWASFQGGDWSHDSSLSFFAHLTGDFFWTYILYFGFVATIFALSFKKWLQIKWPRPWSNERILSLFCYLTVIYALTVPRLKDYSTWLLVPALLQALVFVRQKPGMKILLITLLIATVVGGQFMHTPLHLLTVVLSQRRFLVILVLFILYQKNLKSSEPSSIQG